MPKRKDRKPGTDGGSSPMAAPPELVVLTHREAAVRSSAAGVLASLAGAPTRDLEAVLADHGATMQPIMGTTQERVLASLGGAPQPFDGSPAADLTSFYTIDAPAAGLEALRSDLEGQDLVEAAYIKPGAEPAMLNDMAPAAEEAPPATADFSARQLYLDAAPGGIEARWAWTQNGGRGANVRI